MSLKRKCECTEHVHTAAGDRMRNRKSEVQEHLVEGVAPVPTERRLHVPQRLQSLHLRGRKPRDGWRMAPVIALRRVCAAAPRGRRAVRACPLHRSSAMRSSAKRSSARARAHLDNQVNLEVMEPRELEALGLDPAREAPHGPLLLAELLEGARGRDEFHQHKRVQRVDLHDRAAAAELVCGADVHVLLALTEAEHGRRLVEPVGHLLDNDDRRGGEICGLRHSRLRCGLRARVSDGEAAKRRSVKRKCRDGSK